MKFIGENKIKLDRELNQLDRFVLDFIDILKKHADYVIISGYVSILFGRARATEDIDLFIEKMEKKRFFKFYKEVREKGFWCINAESENEVFSYLEEGLAIRFAKEGNAIPNFEMKFPRNKLDEGTFQDFIIVVLPEGEIKISSLERHIAFKRYYLKSDKDMEDAVHIEALFRDKINYDKVNKLKELIDKYGR